MKIVTSMYRKYILSYHGNIQVTFRAAEKWVIFYKLYLKAYKI